MGHVRWQITEVENKESGEMFQGSRLTHRELETRVDLLNDPSPVSSPLFFFPPPLVFSPSPFSRTVCFLRTRDKHWQSETGGRLLRIAINRSNLIKARRGRSIPRRIRPSDKDSLSLSLSLLLKRKFFLFF